MVVLDTFIGILTKGVFPSDLQGSTVVLGLLSTAYYSSGPVADMAYLLKLKLSVLLATVDV